jgi:hypothetical protein
LLFYSKNYRAIVGVVAHLRHVNALPILACILARRTDLPIRRPLHQTAIPGSQLGACTPLFVRSVVAIIVSVTSPTHGDTFVVRTLPEVLLASLVRAIIMLVRTVKTVVIAITFPTGVDTVVIFAPKFTLVAQLNRQFNGYKL